VRNWTIVGNGQTFYLFIESGDNTAPLAARPFVSATSSRSRPATNMPLSSSGASPRTRLRRNIDPLHTGVIVVETSDTWA
jgi:hypothetical protein